MNVILEGFEPIEEAFGRLKIAPLEAAGEEKIIIYKNANLRLGEFFPREVNPTSLYVLSHSLRLIRQMRAQLVDRYQIDILQLTSILHIRDGDGELDKYDKVIGIAPPFVEIYEEIIQIIPHPEDRCPPGPLPLQIPILKDGIHRAWIAKELGVKLSCIVASGALKKHLPYAYPNDWLQVRVYDKKPEQKKYYRRQNPYSFMRPLRVLRQTSDTPPPPEWNRKIP